MNATAPKTESLLKVRVGRNCFCPIDLAPLLTTAFAKVPVGVPNSMHPKTIHLLDLIKEMMNSPEMNSAVAEIHGFDLDIARKNIDAAGLRIELKDGPLINDYNFRVHSKRKWVYGDRRLSIELCAVMLLSLRIKACGYKGPSGIGIDSPGEIHCGHFLMAVLVHYSTDRKILGWLYTIGIIKKDVDKALRSDKSMRSLFYLNQLQVIHEFNNIVNVALRRREWRDLADYMKIALIRPESMCELASKLGIDHAKDIESMATKDQWNQVVAYCEVFGIDPSNSDIPFDRIVPHC